MSAPELCKLAQSHSVQNVELRSLKGVADYPAFVADDPEELSLLARYFRECSLQVRVVGSSFDLLAHSERDIGCLLSVCKVADRLGAPYVRIFGGGGVGESLSRLAIGKAVRLHDLACAACAGAGIKSLLVVETHGAYVNSVIIRDFCAMANTPVNLLWDSHHTWRLGGENPKKTWREIGSMVRHVHCKDSVFDQEGSKGYRYVLPGRGRFPFDDLLAALTAFDGLLSLEWERQWHPELGPVSEAIEALKDTIDAFLLKNQNGD